MSPPYIFKIDEIFEDHNAVVVHVYDSCGHWWPSSNSGAQAEILKSATKPGKPGICESGHLYKAQVALDLLDALASKRTSSGTTTNPLIFIAYGYGVQVVSRALHLANDVPTAKRASFESILNLTYGVVSVPSRRHRLVRAFTLAAGQLACYIPLRNYENTHGMGTESCVVFSPAHTSILRNMTERSKISEVLSSAKTCNHAKANVSNQVTRVIINVQLNVNNYRFLPRFFFLFSTCYRAHPRPSSLA
jgi:hypothetical protein